MSKAEVIRGRLEAALDRVETALAAAAGGDEEVLNESADLIYHLLVLLRSRKLELGSLVEVLKIRHGA